MTTTQKLLIAAALVVSVGVGLYEAKENAKARAEVRTLQQQQAPLAEQIRQLQAERDKATNRIAWLNEQLAKNTKNNSELLRLRGQVGGLQTQLAKTKNQLASAKPNIDQPALSSAEEYFRRADLHHSNHEYEAELQDLNKAIELDPNMIYVYKNRGILFAMDLPEEKGGLKQGVADLTRFLEVKPDDSIARWNRAMDYEQLKEYDKSIADWTAYIQVDIAPSDKGGPKTQMLADALFNRGRIYHTYLKDFSKAIADYTAAIKLNTNMIGVHRMRGQCYEALGEKEKAQQDFAIEPKPN